MEKFFVLIACCVLSSMLTFLIARSHTADAGGSASSASLLRTRDELKGRADARQALGALESEAGGLLAKVEATEAKLRGLEEALGTLSRAAAGSGAATAAAAAAAMAGAGAGAGSGAAAGGGTAARAGAGKPAGGAARGPPPAAPPVTPPEEGGAPPGAEPHPVLLLSDEEYAALDPSTVIEQYGPTRRAGQDQSYPCEANFGKGLTDRWRDARRDYCVPGEGASGDAQRRPSRVSCHFIKQHRHGGAGDQLCEMENVAIDFSALGDAATTDAVMERYVKTQHRDEAYVHWTPGFITGDCAPVRREWQRERFPGWNEDMLFRGFEGRDAALDCEEWVEHPVILVQRHTFANFFHDSEDFFNVFLALTILRWRIGDAQVLLLDLYPRGPFWPAWAKAFGAGRAPMTAWDLKERYAGRKVCFRRAAMGIYGPAASITLAGFNTPCRHSALVRAYADLFLRGLGTRTLLRDVPRRRSVVVTWMARRPSVDWPELNFCDGLFFKCELFRHLGTRNLQRQVRNEAAVVEALRGLHGEELPGGGVVEFRERDYNLMSFEEQIQNDADTSIMVGPHGAGLQHSLYMPDRGVLIELNIDGTSGRRHFHNMARWHGRPYIAGRTENPVDVRALVDTVREAARKLDVARY